MHKMHERKLDKIDKLLLEYMQENCKRTAQQLSDKLKKAGINLGQAAVRLRVDELHADGYITHYHGLVDPKTIGLPFACMVMVNSSDKNGASGDRLLDEMKKSPYVLDLLEVFGKIDYLLKLKVPEMRVVLDFSQKLRSLGATVETLPVAAAHKETCILPLSSA
jgi:DNA-binding Lrp family transcriptional regulator